MTAKFAMSPAISLDDARERANRFQAQLRQRNVHIDVLRYCSTEILARNSFHAVFEAMKSLTAKIRGLAGVDSDGHRLVDDAFSFSKRTLPIIAIKSLETETQRGEQRGFASLIKGIFWYGPLLMDRSQETAWKRLAFRKRHASVPRLIKTSNHSKGERTWQT